MLPTSLQRACLSPQPMSVQCWWLICDRATMLTGILYTLPPFIREYCRMHSSILRAVLWKASIRTKNRMASKEYFRQTSIPSRSSISWQKTGKLSRPAFSRPTNILQADSDLAARVSLSRKVEQPEVSSPAQRMFSSLIQILLSKRSVHKQQAISAEEDVFQVPLLEHLTVLLAAQLLRVHLLHGLSQLLEPSVLLLQGSVVLRCFVGPFLYLKLLLFVLPDLQLIFFVRLHPPGKLNCLARSLREDFLVDAEGLQDWLVVSSEDTAETVLFLYGKEGQKAVYSWEAFLVVVVAHYYASQYLLLLQLRRDLYLCLRLWLFLSFWHMLLLAGRLFLFFGLLLDLHLQGFLLLLLGWLMRLHES